MTLKVFFHCGFSLFNDCFRFKIENCKNEKLLLLDKQQHLPDYRSVKGLKGNIMISAFTSFIGRLLEKTIPLI